MLNAPAFDVYVRLGLRPRSELERAEDAVRLARSELGEVCRMVEAGDLQPARIHLSYLSLCAAEARLENLKAGVSCD